MSHEFENLRTLEKLAELFNNHDLDRIMEFFAEEDCGVTVRWAALRAAAEQRCYATAWRVRVSTFLVSVL
jgi:hypothetical protein